MAHFETPRPAPFGAITVYRIVRFFEDGVEVVRRWRAQQRTDATLRKLSDRELDDIGLNRGLIEDVSTLLSHRR